MDDAEEISRELGFTTVKVQTHSKPVWQLSNGKTGRQRSVSVSEQKRPLMLPQEVRSLGKTRAIVFTEDTPPILCNKIRYYRVRALQERIRKPPAVPAIALRCELASPRCDSEPPESNESVVADSESNTSPEGSATGGAATSVRFHEAVVEDLEQIDTLMPEDFETDFSKVQIPEHDGEVSVEEMQTAVTDFLDTLKR
jgi:type IV secretion system protein VirD4